MRLYVDLEWRRVTRRERAVLERLAAGERVTEIARELGISTGSVSVYAHSLVVKLGAEDRAHAIVLARARGLC